MIKVFEIHDEQFNHRCVDSVAGTKFFVQWFGTEDSDSKVVGVQLQVDPTNVY